MNIRQKTGDNASLLRLEFLILKLAFMFQAANALIQISYSVGMYFGFGLCENQDIIYGLKENTTSLCVQNFFLITTLAPVSSNIAFTIFDYWNFATIFYTYAFLVAVAGLCVRYFVGSLADAPNRCYPQLFTIDIKNIESERQLQVLCGLLDIMNPQTAYVRTVNLLKEEAEEEDDYRRLDTEREAIVAPKNGVADTPGFLGRAWITLSFLDAAYKVVSLHDQGLLVDNFLTAYRRLQETVPECLEQLPLTESVEMELLSLKKIKIRAADDSNDLNWIEIRRRCYFPNVRLPFFKRISQRFSKIQIKFFLFLVYLGFVGGLFVLVYYLKYWSTQDYLGANFGVISPNVEVAVWVVSYKTTYTAISFDLLIVLLPWIGVKAMRLVIVELPFSRFSTIFNVGFFLEAIYTLVYQLIASYYGYKNSVLDFRDQVSVDRYGELFYTMQMQFVVNAGIAFGAAIFQPIFILASDALIAGIKKLAIFVITGIPKIFSRKKKSRPEGNPGDFSPVGYQQRLPVRDPAKSQPKSVGVRESDSEIQQLSFFSNLSLYFFWLSFYQSAICPTTQLIMTIFLALNLLLAWVARKRVSVRPQHLSFQHVSFILVSLILIYSAGGIFSYDTLAVLSYRYFTQSEYSDNFFPFSLVAACVGVACCLPLFYFFARKNTGAAIVVQQILSDPVRLRRHTQSFEEWLGGTGYEAADPNSGLQPRTS